MCGCVLYTLETCQHIQILMGKKLQEIDILEIQYWREWCVALGPEKARRVGFREQLRDTSHIASRGKGEPWWSWSKMPVHCQRIKEVGQLNTATTCVGFLLSSLATLLFLLHLLKTWGLKLLPFQGKQGWNQGNVWYRQDLNIFDQCHPPLCC